MDIAFKLLNKTSVTAISVVENYYNYTHRPDNTYEINNID